MLLRLLPHALAPAGAILALVATPALAQRNAGILEGDHFRVIPHLGSTSDALREELVLAALESAEAAWVHATAVYGLDPESSAQGPLRIHLYRERAAFDDACFRCEGRTWPNNSGLTSGNWGIALIHLGRGLPDAALAAVGLTDADRELVAHEATHLLGSHLAAGYAAHPSWLTEGVAEWVAQRSTLDESGDEAPRPTIDSRQAHLQELLSRGELPGLWSLLRDELDELDTYRRYALNGSFVGFLLAGSDSRALQRVLRETRADTEPGEVLRLFLSGLGEGSLDGLEQRFRRSLLQSTPSWSLGSGVLQSAGADGWWQLAPQNEPAVAWRLPAVAEGDYQLTGRFSLSPGATQRLEVRLGRTLAIETLRGAPRHWDERYLSVSFEAHGVSVRAHEDWRKGGRSSRSAEELAQAPLSIGHAEAHAFRISVRGERLTVQLDGQPLLEARLTGHSSAGQSSAGQSSAGQWGLAAGPGSFGRWSDLRLVR